MPVDLSMCHYRYRFSLVNGQLGGQIHCGRGLQQGDPLSFYLFLLVVNVLQNTLKGCTCWASKTSRHFPHPPLLSSTCIYAHSYVYGPPIPNQLENHFCLFWDTIRIQINYTKSYIFKLELTSDTQMHTALAILKCQVGPQPFTYLVIPLKNTKLVIREFLQLIDKVRHQLPAWKENNLLKGERLVLINVVLIAIPLHYMYFSLYQMGNQWN